MISIFLISTYLISIFLISTFLISIFLISTYLIFTNLISIFLIFTCFAMIGRRLMGVPLFCMKVKRSSRKLFRVGSMLNSYSCQAKL